MMMIGCHRRVGRDRRLALRVIAVVVFFKIILQLNVGRANYAPYYLPGISNQTLPVSLAHIAEAMP